MRTTAVSCSVSLQPLDGSSGPGRTMVTFAMIDLHTHKCTHGIQLLEFRDKGINPYTALTTTVEAFLREAEKAVVLCDRSGEGRAAGRWASAQVAVAPRNGRAAAPRLLSEPGPTRRAHTGCGASLTHPLRGCWIPWRRASFPSQCWLQSLICQCCLQHRRPHLHCFGYLYGR